MADVYYEQAQANEKTFNFSYLLHLLESYGWHLLAFSILLAIIYNAYLKPYVERYQKYRFEKEYAAKYHKNPDHFAAHLNAQQKYVDRLQEQYSKSIEENEKKLEKKAEKKRQEILEQAGGSGSRLGNKNDHYPLMGHGSSGGSYRPERKSPCGSGGCGK